MSLRGAQVLVTGAGGFIGSHLAERLVVDGAKVRAMVHYNALGSWGWLDESPHAGNMEVLAGDILDGESVREAMSGCEVVFHLAALIAIPYSYRAPKSYVRTNVEGTLHVLHGARSLGTKRVIVTSTSEVYGTARTVPITEAHPLQAQSPYSATKIAADKIAESFHLSFGVPVVTLRPFNTFGPRQSARAVVPTIITQALAGDQVRLGNTAPTRDMNYVSNTVDGYMAAATAPGIDGETIQLGTGREVSVGDLVPMIGQILGKELRIARERERERREGSEVERLVADASRAGRLLGWKPQVTLEQGLERTVEFMRTHAARYRAGQYAV
ncbi:MAG: GDP-mannose 4,6-dehydratase [Deltaproteobacteria bacterium]|nr:GDP-mannose 4,6-dehydratase [Deltaproteobacteria bacterium]